MAIGLLRHGVTLSHAKLITRHTNTQVLDNHDDGLDLSDAVNAMARLPWLGKQSNESSPRAVENTASRSRFSACACTHPHDRSDRLPSSKDVCDTRQSVYTSVLNVDRHSDAPVGVRDALQIWNRIERRAISSVGQSASLTRKKSQVRVLYRPFDWFAMTCNHS